MSAIRTLPISEYVPTMFTADADGTDRCSCCGKKISTRGNAQAIIITDGGDSIVHPDDDALAMEYSSGYMGVWPVGATCIKRVPAEYRLRFDVVRWQVIR